MRKFMMVFVMMGMAAGAAGQAHAQMANPDAMAYQMNRDGDYPWDPSDRQYLVPPEPREVREYQREVIQYKMNQKAQAKANWVAMTPDEKRRFMRRHPEAFQPGGLLGDY